MIINGEAMIAFTINNHGLTYKFQICSGLISKGILGCDWLNYFDAHIDFAYKPAMLSLNSKIAYREKSQEKSCIQRLGLNCISTVPIVHKITAFTTIFIPPATGVWIILVIPRGISKGQFNIKLSDK